MANNFTQEQFTPRRIYEQKYKTSRMNLLLVVVFTAINLVLLVTNADSYFLFSAFIPYFIASIGMLMCGLFPKEFYTDGLEEIVFLDKSFFAVLLIVSVVLTLLYLLAWLFSSKDRVGWLVFALAFFGIDTLGMLYLNGISFDSIFDILFHAWVIYYLIVGISSHYKLKKLPPDEEIPLTEETLPQNVESGEEIAEPVAEQIQTSSVIRKADKDVKHRVLLEVRTLNYDICYRRVKHTNELVINGNVYDLFEGAVEPAHTLQAYIDGHCIRAGFTGTHSFISVDGNNVAKKLRLF